MPYTGEISSKEIEQAIEEGELSLNYQPQSSLVMGGITGIEALVRWHSKTLGQVDTGHFIGILEHSEISSIVKFHEWLIQNAFKQIIAWRQIGILAPVYLNFSTRYLQQRGCLDQIQHFIQKYDIHPSWFGIEVTETCSITDMPEIKFVLEYLCKIGVKIALDDFCTGYSSLEYIIDFPVETIKIDKRFIQSLCTESYQRRNSISIILESLIEMAFKLGIKVVAEGVETMKQLEIVTFLGCDAYQGYFFCPPIPADVICGMNFEQHNQNALSVSCLMFPA